MGLWPRAIATAVAVVVAALLLKVAPPFVVLAVFVGGIVAVSVRARRTRIPERRVSGELLGLTREPGDPFGVLSFPLSLFARTPQPAIDELVWGRWRGIDVHTFDLSFERRSVAGQQVGRATFACAIATIEAALPGIVVEPDTFVMQLDGSPPGSPVETGDGAFDVAMDVRSDDASFARELLDAPTRAWLRSLEMGWGVEVRGRLAAVYGPRSARPDLVALLETLRDLLERLPKDVGAPRPPAVEGGTGPS